jgi:dynactin complex subunit
MKAMIAMRDKENVKAKQILIKEDIKKTRDELTENLKTLRAQLRGKRKKYTEQELENK